MKKQLFLIATMALSLTLFGCGKKTVNTTPTGTSSQAVVAPPPAPPAPPPAPPPAAGAAPLSFEINQTGGSSVFSTPSIANDNLLRVRYEVGPAGNQFFDATDVRVEITVNGSTKVPKYTLDPNCPTGGCEYGRPSDGPSTILDFTGNLSPGVPSIIQVTQARYNWYCYAGVYPGGVPYWNPYNGCNYRLVQDPNQSIGFPGHYWRGRLIVQTNATDVAQFEGPSP